MNTEDLTTIPEPQLTEVVKFVEAISQEYWLEKFNGINPSKEQVNSTTYKNTKKAQKLARFPLYRLYTKKQNELDVKD